MNANVCDRLTSVDTAQSWSGSQISGNRRRQKWETEARCSLRLRDRGLNHSASTSADSMKELGLVLLHLSASLLVVLDSAWLTNLDFVSDRLGFRVSLAILSNVR
jgi:hypothetical protein